MTARAIRCAAECRRVDEFNVVLHAVDYSVLRGNMKAGSAGDSRSDRIYHTSDFLVLVFAYFCGIIYGTMNAKTEYLRAAIEKCSA